MNIRTERLVIRSFTEKDLDALHAIYSDPEVMEYLGGVFEDKEETRDEMNCSCFGQDAIRYAVAEPRSGKLVGEVTYILHSEEDMKDEAEIGWTLAKEEWGKGYATELTKSLEELAVKNGAKALFLCCEEEQEIPPHIAGKFGLEYMGLEWGQAMYRKTLADG